MEAPQARPALDRALDLVRFLRRNCPWDAAQTPTSLLPYLLEEAHETAEAVQAADDAELRAELGDLLLNLAFQIVLAEERAAFDAEAVAATLEAKMRRRHPHLYGDGPPVPWEELKAREKMAHARPPDEPAPGDVAPAGDAALTGDIARPGDQPRAGDHVHAGQPGPAAPAGDAAPAGPAAASGSVAPRGHVAPAGDAAPAGPAAASGSVAPAGDAAPAHPAAASGSVAAAGPVALTGDHAPAGHVAPARPAPGSVLAGLPRGLDALSKAHRIQEKVSGVGFDWADARGAFDKVAEELEEVRQALEDEPSPALEEELGDLLFAVVNLTRLAGSHSMGALQRANQKFTRRFEALERLAHARGIELGQVPLETLDALWDDVKAAEKRGRG